MLDDSHNQTLLKKDKPENYELHKTDQSETHVQQHLAVLATIFLESISGNYAKHKLDHGCFCQYYKPILFVTFSYFIDHVHSLELVVHEIKSI